MTISEIGGVPPRTASNLTSHINARTQTISYTYDALNRLTQKVTPADTFTYTYDKANRLLTAANATGTITNTYDGRGRLSTVTYPGSLVLTYGYDAANNRTSLAYPSSGPTPTYAYDNLNRPTNLTDLNGSNVTFAYDALSRRASLGLPNGVTSTYAYDAINRLTSLSHANGGGSLSSFSYGYDNIGNRTSITDPQGSHTLTYDPLSQLTQITNPTVSYAYDATGNRTTAAGVSYTTNTKNQYTAVGGATHTHDNDGNLTSDGTSTYTWNAENQLTQAVKGSTTTAFTYDALGRRASKTIGSTTTKFLYDGLDLIAETDGSNTITATYLIGPRIDEPVERKAGSTTTYYSADGLGSIAHLTNSSAALIEQYSYDAYGTPTLKDGSGSAITATAYGNSFLFTGREWDAELSLYYYRARFYSSAIGRFLSRDPISYSSDMNLYRYVGNNPLNRLDPSGQLSLAVLVGSVVDALQSRPKNSPLPLQRVTWLSKRAWHRLDYFLSPYAEASEKPIEEQLSQEAIDAAEMATLIAASEAIGLTGAFIHVAGGYLMIAPHPAAKITGVGCELLALWLEAIALDMLPIPGLTIYVIPDGDPGEFQR